MKAQRFIGKVILVYVVLVWGAATVGQAQILNVEKARLERDSARFFVGNISLSFNMYNRNAGKNDPNTFLAFLANGDVAYYSQKHSFLLLNYYNYVVVTKNPIVQTGYSHFRANLLRRQKLSYEVFSQYQYDLGRGLELRLLAGGALRLGLIRTPKLNLYVGSGLMLEREEWVNPDFESKLTVKNLAKSTNYLSTRAKLNDYVEFNTINYYQVGPDREDKVVRQRLSSDLNLLVRVTSRLHFKTNFNCTYETRPVVPVTKFIYSFTNGIQVNF